MRYLLLTCVLMVVIHHVLAESEETPVPKKEETTETSPPPKTAPTQPERTPLEQGKTLHSNHCVSCHTAEIYTRKERKVSRYEGLQNQVQACAVNLDLPWFDDEINAVVTYLNTDYYQFKRPTEEETSQKANKPSK